MSIDKKKLPRPRAEGLGRLVLVRHGQARFDAGLSGGYDRLSDLGWLQGELLGRHWAEAGIQFGRVFVGPLRRQRETLSAVAKVYAERGLPWPEAMEIGDLAEHRGTEAFAELLPGLGERRDRLGELARQLEEEGGGLGPLYLKVYRHTVRAWARGELPEADARFESWRDFRRRVVRAVEAMVDGAAMSDRIVAFTSGGPVAAAAAWTLDLADEPTLELSWVVQNCSASELLFSPTRVTLKSFNAHSLLEAAGMATFI